MMKFRNTLLSATVAILAVGVAGCLGTEEGDDNEGGGDETTTVSIGCDYASTSGYCADFTSDAASEEALETACTANEGTVIPQCSATETILATCETVSEGITITENYGATYMIWGEGEVSGYCSLMKTMLQAGCEEAGGIFTDIEGQFAAYECPTN